MRVAATLGYERTRVEARRAAEDLMTATRLEIVQPVSSSVTVRAGADLVIDRYQADSLPTFADDDDVVARQRRIFASRTDFATGIRADAVIVLDPRMEVTPGVRLDIYGSDQARAIGIDPRIAARFAVSDKVRIVHAYGLATQPPSPPIALPAVSIARLEGGLQRSAQTSAGVEIDLPSDVTTTATVFHQAFYDLNDALGTAQVQIIDIEKSDSLLGKSRGSAYGLELGLRRKLTRTIGGLLAYTLSRSERTAEGRTFLSTYNRPHVLNAALSFDLGKRMAARVAARLLQRRAGLSCDACISRAGGGRPAVAYARLRAHRRTRGEALARRQARLSRGRARGAQRDALHGDHGLSMWNAARRARRTARAAALCRANLRSGHRAERRHRGRLLMFRSRPSRSCLPIVATCVVALVAACVPADEALPLGAAQFTVTGRGSPRTLSEDRVVDEWSIHVDRFVLSFRTMTIVNLMDSEQCAYRGRGARTNVVFEGTEGSVVQAFNGLKPGDCPDVGLRLGPPDDESVPGEGATADDLVALASGTPAHALLEATAVRKARPPFTLEDETMHVSLRFDSVRTASSFGGCRDAVRGARIRPGARYGVFVAVAAEAFFRDAISSSAQLRFTPFADADRRRQRRRHRHDGRARRHPAGVGGGPFYQLPNGSRSGSFGDYVRAQFMFAVTYGDGGLCNGIVPGTEDQ